MFQKKRNEQKRKETKIGQKVRNEIKKNKQTNWKMEQKEGKKINEWRKNRSKGLKEMKKRKKTERNENKLKRRQERKTMTRLA